MNRLRTNGLRMNRQQRTALKSKLRSIGGDENRR
jgi:hypothetical protein